MSNVIKVYGIDSMEYERLEAACATLNAFADAVHSYGICNVDYQEELGAEHKKWTTIVCTVIGEVDGEVIEAYNAWSPAVQEMLLYGDYEDFSKVIESELEREQ